MSNSKFLDYYEERALKPEYWEKAGWNKKGFWIWFSNVMEIVLSLNKKSILDVGCGSGFYVKCFRDFGMEAKGIDISPNQIKNAKMLFKLGKEVEVGNAENLNFEENSFDIVLSVGAFQLCENPEKALKEMARVSKEIVILTATNSKLITLLFKSKEGRFSERELKKIISRNNLEVLEMRRLAINPFLNALCRFSSRFNDYFIFVLKK